MTPRRFVTVVVGAGPAGLLFCLVAAIRAGRHDPAIFLVDKRSSYERSHRLRMDRRPYEAVKGQVDHPLFDELIEFLELENFRPAANHLEAKLEELVARLGISKQKLVVGRGPGELDLIELRARLEGSGVLHQDGDLMVVGADSVKSATRSMLADESESVERVHQTVARLRIDGDSIPASIDPIRQLKMAKLLGSAIDYRFNQNGFAEIDLFLSPEEHRMVDSLGARPAEPVALTPALVDHLGAPLFASVVDHLVRDLGQGPNRVSIHSTFRLEHRYQNRVAFVDEESTGPRTAVFLVGDAAVSLPFFRGMACLMACADELASVHADLANGEAGQPDLAAGVERYDQAVAVIRKREVATVESRARALRLARELVRISAMAPFPIQTWLLSSKPEQDVSLTPSKRFTTPLLTTILLVWIAAALAVLSPVIGVVGLFCIPVQAAAGALYRSDLASPRRPNPAMAVVCRLQVSALMVAGLAIVVLNPFDSGLWIRAGAAIGWWVLGLVFVVGMYAYEERAGSSKHSEPIDRAGDHQVECQDRPS